MSKFSFPSVVKTLTRCCPPCLFNFGDTLGRHFGSNFFPEARTFHFNSKTFFLSVQNWQKTTSCQLLFFLPQENWFTMATNWYNSTPSPSVSLNITPSSDGQFLNVVKTFKFAVEGIGIMTFGLFGLVINLFALYILFKKQVGWDVHHFLFRIRCDVSSGDEEFPPSHVLPIPLRFFPSTSGHHVFCSAGVQFLV